MASQLDANRIRLKNLYDQYRTARMNREYYGCRLHSYQQINLIYEIVLALGTSSAVAGFYFWKTEAGKEMWAAFGVVVVILSVLKPVLQLSKKVERYSRLHAGYGALFYDLKGVVDDAREAGGLDPKMKELIDKAGVRYRELGVEDDPKASDKLLRKCQESVKRSTPPFQEWWPEQST